MIFLIDKRWLQGPQDLQELHEQIEPNVLCCSFTMSGLLQSGQRYLRFFPLLKHSFSILIFISRNINAESRDFFIEHVNS